MEAFAGQRGSWLRRLTDPPTPRAYLICFPHSGGSASFFLDWAQTLPEDVSLLAVQYPARADRFAEEPAASVASMARGAAEELQTLGPTPHIILFGHSLGALVAYEVARLLHRSAPEQALTLGVSGSSAPALAGGGDTHLLPDAALWSTVCGFGGIDPEVANSPGLRDVLLISLRADLSCNANYRAGGDSPALPIPVIAFHGVDDPLTTPQDVMAWNEVTSSQFRFVARDGGHFHLLRALPDLTSALLSSISAAR